MKKILFCAAAVAMLGLASCSSKADKGNDTATVDSLNDTNVMVEQTTDVTVQNDSNGNPESATVTQVTEVAEEVTPAQAQ